MQIFQGLKAISAPFYNKSSDTLLVIDPAVDNYQDLIVGIDSRVEAIILHPNQDGVDQITAALNYCRKVSSVHIICHGEPGDLYLGNTRLNLETLNQYAQQLCTWFSLSSTRTIPSLFLYGCSIAQGEVGAQFIDELHRLLGTKIAASTTPIGHSALGGNWELDYQIGQINIEIPIASAVLDEYPVILAAPSITDEATSSRTVQEDPLAPFAITDITVADADTGDTQTITLSVTQGSLNITAASGITIITGSGTTIEFSGTAADVTNAFSSGNITYTPNSDYNGAETLTISANDGSSSPVSTDVAITIDPVADAINDTLTTDEDTAGSLNVLTSNDNFEDPTAEVTAVSQGSNGSVSFSA
uniref:DUF4347 domain-containing protein n=1 Tax=Acaryochloris sp. IP29b_bin.137 TaxID=2969217 RepID=UPI0026304653